jgi:L-gulonate 3-dehydrogenase
VSKNFAVVGSGSIGIAWSIVFARAGNNVRVFDIDAERIQLAKNDFSARLEMLQKIGLLTEKNPEILNRVQYFTDLPSTLVGAEYVQESIPEKLDLKQQVFRELDSLTEKNVILASSSSAITASEFAGDLPGRSRCLVVHPGNPPYLLPVAEVVPAPFTNQEIVSRTSQILLEVKMKPILVHAEIEGFVFNRLQGAILREAYCLVRDGIVSALDVDRIVTQGLARRWAVIGPFATSSLNVQGGIRAHVARMGATYESMGKLRGQNDPWTSELAELVAEEIDELLPVENWSKNVLRRDEALLELSRLIENNPTFEFGY